MFLLLTITNVPMLVRDNSTALASTLSAISKRKGQLDKREPISPIRLYLPGEDRIIKLYATKPPHGDSFDFILQERIPTTPEGVKMLNESVPDEAHRQSKIENGALSTTAWISVEPDIISVRHSGSSGIFESKVERETGEITFFERERVGVRTSVVPDETKADETIYRPLFFLSLSLRELERLSS